MSVKFKSRQAYLQVTHEEIFHAGVIHTLFRPNEEGNMIWIGSQEEWERLESIPDPDMVNRSYWFREGENRNELTLERKDAIEGMRAYIRARKDNIIVELDVGGNEPADSAGVIFECRTPCSVLYPAMYQYKTTAEGKTFRFNMGAKQNRYITADVEEIKILRAYISGRCDAEYTEVKE